ncbi:SFT2 domain containing 2a isoform X2 [Denticeps clupeoides]|uniref:SFT2 domain containing 2a isoform X2 n=1 Tax=Denticeps clupeoides TaxID=299321 RepID=UPI0010A36A3E|nr:vesicle transport protein SFT2B-like isoform X2 [Denticeps clupeoides]
MDKLRAVLSGRDESTDQRGVIETVNEASTLGWGTRVKGFIACMVLGLGCSVLGVGCLFIPKIGITLFIVFYTFGNICSLARRVSPVSTRPLQSTIMKSLRDLFISHISTMFLMGPVKQLKRMCDKTRAFATAVMLTCLVLTLCAAFWWKIFGLALLFVILQVIAFVWYGLSYIPFARDAVLKFFSMLCSMCMK